MFKSLEAQCMKIVAGPSMKNSPVNCGLYILIHEKIILLFYSNFYPNRLKT